MWNNLGNKEGMRALMNLRCLFITDPQSQQLQLWTTSIQLADSWAAGREFGGWSRTCGGTRVISAVKSIKGVFFWVFFFFFADGSVCRTHAHVSPNANDGREMALESGVIISH